MIFREQPTDFKKGMSVVACYLEHNGTFVLLHRHVNKSNGDKWGLPAGKMEKGESMQQAMRREILEETGLDVPEERLNYFDSLFVRHENRDFEYHMFSTDLKDKPRIVLSSSEHKDSRWVTPEESLEMNLIYDLDECTRLFYDL
jgi:8-oxo-dGTP pyrophosphatase MutT (NUDIX family)